MRESMAADLIDRLVADIVDVTEKLMVTDPVDMAALHVGPTSIERRAVRPGHRHEQEKGIAKPSEEPPSKGIHRYVC